MKEKEKLEKDETAALEYLGDVLIATNQNHETATEDIKGSYQEVRDEYRNRVIKQ